MLPLSLGRSASSAARRRGERLAAAGRAALNGEKGFDSWGTHYTQEGAEDKLSAGGQATRAASISDKRAAHSGSTQDRKPLKGGWRGLARLHQGWNRPARRPASAAQ